MKLKMSNEVKAVKATAGPWHTPGETFIPMKDGHKAHKYRAIGIGNGACHIGYASVTTCVNEDEALANARLIASAPCLLEALKEMLRCNHELGAISRPVAEQARAAIAKATGE